MSKIFLRHTLTKKILDIFDSLSLYIFTIWKCIAYNFFCRGGIYFDKILVSEYKLFKRSNKWAFISHHTIKRNNIYCSFIAFQTSKWYRFKLQALAGKSDWPHTLMFWSIILYFFNAILGQIISSSHFWCIFQIHIWFFHLIFGQIRFVVLFLGQHLITAVADAMFGCPTTSW